MTEARRSSPDPGLVQQPQETHWCRPASRRARGSVVDLLDRRIGGLSSARSVAPFPARRSTFVGLSGSSTPSRGSSRPYRFGQRLDQRGEVGRLRRRVAVRGASLSGTQAFLSCAGARWPSTGSRRPSRHPMPRAARIVSRRSVGERCGSSWPGARGWSSAQGSSTGIIFD